MLNFIKALFCNHNYEWKYWPYETVLGVRYHRDKVCTKCGHELDIYNRF